jgi:hypothetical protein
MITKLPLFKAPTIQKPSIIKKSIYAVCSNYEIREILIPGERFTQIIKIPENYIVTGLEILKDSALSFSYQFTTHNRVLITIINTATRQSCPAVTYNIKAGYKEDLYSISNGDYLCDLILQEVPGEKVSDYKPITASRN